MSLHQDVVFVTPRNTWESMMVIANCLSVSSEWYCTHTCKHTRSVSHKHLTIIAKSWMWHSSPYPNHISTNYLCGSGSSFWYWQYWQNGSCHNYSTLQIMIIFFLFNSTLRMIIITGNDDIFWLTYQPYSSFIEQDIYLAQPWRSDTIFLHLH